MQPVKKHRYLFLRGNAYVFRRVVPKHLVETFGQREVHTSFGSRGLSEVRLLLADAITDFEQRVLAATGQAPPKDALAFSRLNEPSPDEVDECVRAWLASRLGREPSTAFLGAQARDRGRQRLQELQGYADDVARGIALGADEPTLTTVWIVETLIETSGWRVEEGSPTWHRLVRLVGRAQIEVSGWQAAEITGEPRVVRDTRFSPDQYRLDTERQKERAVSAPLSLRSLLDLYIVESSARPASIKAWKRHIRAFIAYAGHDDANRVTRSDVEAWKRQLLNEPNAAGKVLSPKTVRDTYLSILKTVFSWAHEEGKIRDNPTGGVKVRKKIAARLRTEPGLSDLEANLILRATTTPAPGRLSARRALARRWVPWICAYVGARVNEITQLRGEDIYHVNGIWVMRITPEAGGTKDGKMRIVPLHDHIIEQGFLRAIAGRTGPLFYDPTLHRGGSDGNPQYKKVGEYLARWVREVGVSDPAVQPNHGWRHRFKTQSRRFGMDGEITRAIQGHVGDTEAEKYGYYPPEAMLREMKKLPRYYPEASD